MSDPHLTSLREQLNKAIEESLKGHAKQPGLTHEDEEVSKAVEMSLKGQDLDLDYNIDNPQAQLRQPGMPVGLKNIGNSSIDRGCRSLLLQLFPASLLHDAVLRGAHLQLPPDYSNGPRQHTRGRGASTCDHGQY